MRGSRYACVNIVVADALAPNRCQAISIHHADSVLTIDLYKSYQRYHVTAIKWNIFEWRREVGNPLVSLQSSGSSSHADYKQCCIPPPPPPPPPTHTHTHDLIVDINQCHFRQISPCAEPISGNGYIMTSSNGNIFPVTGPLWGESTGYRWIPLSKASDAEPSCFLWSAPEWTVEQTIGTVVIWDVIALIMTSLLIKQLHTHRHDGYILKYNRVCQICNVVSKVDGILVVNGFCLLQ